MIGPGNPYVVTIDIQSVDNTQAGWDQAMQRARRQAQQIEQMRGRSALRTNYNVQVGANTNRLTSRIREVDQSLTRLTRTPRMIRVSADTRGAMEGLNSLARQIRTLRTLSIAIGTLGGGAAAIGDASNLADNLYAARIGFQTTMKSMFGQTTEEANRFFERIQAFAIATPYKTEQAIQQTMRLLAGGFRPDELIGPDGVTGMLNTIGDATAHLGDQAEEMQSRLVKAFVDIRGAGRLNAQDLRQFTEAGMPVYRYLMEGLNRPKAEGGGGMHLRDEGQVRELARKNQINPRAATNYILEGMNRERGGMMTRIANETVGGNLSQISDALRLGVWNRFGEGFNRGVIPFLQRLNRTFNQNKDVLKSWGDTAAGIGEGIGTALSGPLDFVTRMLGSEEFQRSNLFGKLSYVWNAISSSFETWYTGGGKQVLQQVAGDIGEGIGTFISEGLRAIMNIEPGGKNVFSDASSTAARSFGEGFMRGLDDLNLGKQLNDWAARQIKPSIEWHTITLPGGGSFSYPDLAFGRGAAAAGGPARAEGTTAFGPPAPAGLATAPGTTGSGKEFGTYYPGGTAAAGGMPQVDAQFGNTALVQQLQAMGFSADVIEDVCGPIAAAGIARALGKAVTTPEMVGRAQSAGLWSPGVGMKGPKSFEKLLELSGLEPERLQENAALRRLSAGEGQVAISTAKHYFLASGMRDGLLDVGSTGLAAKGGAERMSLADIARTGGGIQAYIGAKQKAPGSDLRQLARRIATEQGINPDIFERQIQQESGFNPRAVSAAGAQGLGQLMPGTARGLGVTDPFDPEQNLRGSARFMKDLLRQTGGNYEKALRGYNAGPGNIEASRGFGETNTYVRKILGGQRGGGDAPGYEGEGGGYSIQIGSITFPVIAATGLDEATAEAFATSVVDKIMHKAAVRLTESKGNAEPR